MELKKGLWIAQGEQTNVLLLLGGESPMLEFLGGIDLNHFKKTGKTRELTKNSPEIVDILMYPERYNFALPSVTETIDALGFTTEFEGLKEHPQKDEIIEDGLEYYKTTILLYGVTQAKTRTRLYLLRKYNLKMNQANYVFSLICKICNRPVS